MATGRQLRDLFATLLCDCTPSDPLHLWMDFQDKICNNLQHRLQIQNLRQNPTPEDTYDFGLFLIEEILQRSNKSLQNWPILPLPQQNWEHAIGNWLIAKQRKCRAAGIVCSRLYSTPQSRTAISLQQNY